MRPNNACDQTFLFLFNINHLSAHSEVFSSFVIQYDSIQHHSFIYTVKWFQVAQSAGAVEYTDCFSAEG